MWLCVSLAYQYTMITLGEMQLSMVADQGQSTMKAMREQTKQSPGDVILGPQTSELPPKGVALTSHFSPCLFMMKWTPLSSLQTKNSLTILYRTIYLTLEVPSGWSSDLNGYQNSLTQSGIMSLLVRWSILMLFSLACTPPSQTIGLSKILVTLFSHNSTEGTES